jgi:tRNA (guanine37-N1)-methyltransferase
MFSSPFNESIIKRAIEKKLIDLEFINLRDFGIGKHKMVDDTPYGGGNGMVLKVDVLHKAILKTKNKSYKRELVFLLSAHGKIFNQKLAKKLSCLDHLILICGHYEGFDERVKKYIDGEISVGDFVLTGGEIPAMLIIDSVARLVKGVIKENSADKESFSPLLEHPQYTKPRDYDGQGIPDILLSGNHKAIEDWKEKQAFNVTKKLRPDLIKKG